MLDFCFAVELSGFVARTLLYEGNCYCYWRYGLGMMCLSWVTTDGCTIGIGGHSLSSSFNGYDKQGQAQELLYEYNMRVISIFRRWKIRYWRNAFVGFHNFGFRGSTGYSYQQRWKNSLMTLLSHFSW